MIRQVIKTGTYSIMHMSVAIAVAYVLSGDWRVALGIGFVEPLVQTVFYTFHEHVWSKVKSKKKPDEKTLHHAV